ncbi:opioid growth factor receptor conserved region-domain-containing protein [Phlebopus sp. FC_14]|nr:opioid growth factor receptor conserved region-domain-containing protein [Phlebopus sp. FC_14]
MSTRIQRSLPRDIQAFLANYRNNVVGTTPPGPSTNHLFYLNKRRCKPDHLFIDEIHARWTGDYDELEYNHGYIQWIFPIQEDGVNFSAAKLQPHEIPLMKNDSQITRRLITSYIMMLDFYGMHLLSEDTGLLSRSLPPKKFTPRYKNLIRAPHNNLRISRILKCLSELGLERFNAAFLLHVLNEQSEHGELNSPLIRDSMDRWWANCIRDESERTWVGRTVAKVRAGEPFTREMYETALEIRRVSGKFPHDE